MILSRSRMLGISALFSSILMLSACGGSARQPASSEESDAGPPVPTFPDTTVSGVFDGLFTDTGKPVTTLVQADGSYYMVYSDAASPQAPVGAVIGDGTLTNGAFSSSNALDLSLRGSGAQTPAAATLDATLVSGQSFHGTLTYLSSGTPEEFDGTFNNAYLQLPALSTVAGVYIGAISTRSVKEDQLEITITSDGNVSGKLSCGCSVAATLAPRSDGTSYEASLSFTGGNHPLSNQSMAGNVYFDMVRNRLYIVGKLGGSADGAIFVGTKQ